MTNGSRSPKRTTSTTSTMKGEQMRDKNGKILTTGQVVKIENSYFKCDNGLYFVERTPGDPYYIGTDLTLTGINKNGTLSKSRKIAFWPLCNFVSDKKKHYEADRWNAKHATIESVEDFNTEPIKEYFIGMADECADRAIYYKRYGHSPKVIADAMQASEFYKSVAERI